MRLLNERGVPSVMENAAHLGGGRWQRLLFSLLPIPC